MKLFVAGISYKTAPVAVREQVAVPPALLASQGCRLKLGAQLEEVILLSTCNRVAIYGTTPWVNGNVHGILRHLGGGDTDYAPYLYVKEGDDVYLYNIDDLEAVVRENVKSREQELGRCAAIINACAEELMTKLNSSPARPPASPDHHGAAHFPIRSLQSLNPSVLVNQCV